LERRHSRHGCIVQVRPVAVIGFRESIPELNLQALDFVPELEIDLVGGGVHRDGRDNLRPHPLQDIIHAGFSSAGSSGFSTGTQSWAKARLTSAGSTSCGSVPEPFPSRWVKGLPWAIHTIGTPSTAGRRLAPHRRLWWPL